MQVPVPEHAPLQPANVEPARGEADRVTLVPELKLDEQVLPQLIPVGLLVTVPLPVPAFTRLRVYVGIALTVNENEEVFVATPDEVAVTLTEVVAGVAPADAEYVNVTLHEPEVGVQLCEFALVNVTPVGKVPTLTVTACAVP